MYALVGSLEANVEPFGPIQYYTHLFIINTVMEYLDLNIFLSLMCMLPYLQHLAILYIYACICDWLAFLDKFGMV